MKEAEPKKVYATGKDAVASLAKALGEPSHKYAYRDVNGQPVGGVIRWDKPNGKDIRPIARNGQGWYVGSMPTPRPLYRLNELATLPKETTVYVVEGEKAAEAAKSIGLFAVTSAGGSKAAGLTDWSPLAGRSVVILPDNDEPGTEYANRIAEALKSSDPPTEVRIVKLPGLPPGGDIADFIEARDSAESNAIKAEVEAIVAKAKTKNAEISLTWSALLATGPEAEPIIPGLLRRGEVMAMISQSGAGKSHLAGALALGFSGGVKRWLEWATVTGRVMVVDTELEAPTIRERYQKIADTFRIPNHHLEPDGKSNLLIEVRKANPIDCFGIRRLAHKRTAEHGPIDLIIVDSFYDTYPDALESENDNAGMVRVVREYTGLASDLACGVILIHHTSKGTQADKQAIDVGAGAGVIARKVDTHLSLRRHEHDGCWIVEAGKVRTFPNFKPFVVRWDMDKRTYAKDPDADPAAHWRAPRRAEGAEPSGESLEPWTPERFARTYLPPTGRMISVDEVIAACKGVFKANAVVSLLRQASEQGLTIYVPGSGGAPRRVGLIVGSADESSVIPI